MSATLDECNPPIRHVAMTVRVDAILTSVLDEK